MISGFFYAAIGLVPITIGFTARYVLAAHGVTAEAMGGDIENQVLPRMAIIILGNMHPLILTVFLAALIFLFESTLVEWAGAAGKDVVTYILTVLVGINFIIELVLNLVLSSVIVRLIKYRQKGVM